MPRHREGPAEWGLNDDSTIDEYVCHGCTIHLEQMDDNCYWMGIIQPDGTHIDLNFWTPRTRIRVNAFAFSDEPPPSGTLFELGEYSSGVRESPWEHGDGDHETV